MKNAKVKYLLSDIDNPAAIAIDWGLLPTELVSQLPGRAYFNVPAITETGKIIEKTVIYIIPTERFKSGVKKIETTDFILGID